MVENIQQLLQLLTELRKLENELFSLSEERILHLSRVAPWEIYSGFCDVMLVQIKIITKSFFFNVFSTPQIITHFSTYTQTIKITHFIVKLSKFNLLSPISPLMSLAN